MARARRRFSWRRELLILFVFLAAALVMKYVRKPSEPVEFAGHFRAVDGDTLTIDRARLRIRGIDAPERAQQCGTAGRLWSCGDAATRALRARLPGLTCKAHSHDKYRRLLVRCRTATGDLGAELVSAGAAVGYGSEYRAEEDAARKARLGVWSGPFERPELWRRNHRPQADIGNLSDFFGRLFQ